jgi:hypothetical protein
MNLWINGARIPPRLDGLRIPILHAEQAIAYASENTCHPKCLAPAERKTSSPCMRLERCAIDRPCTLKCLRVASPPCPTAVIVCVLTSSRPREIHKVTHVSWPPAGTTPVFRLRGITHENPNTTGGSFRVPPPRRPGAKAQSLRPCYAHVPNRKASRVCPGSLQARPRGCVLVNRYMKIETQLENRFERRCSGSSSPVYHGLSSTAPHLHLHHQPRHQPRVILQVCLAWHLLLAAAARTRLAPPLLRPPPSISLVFAQKCLFPHGLKAFLPAMRARSRLAMLPFAWTRLPWSRSHLVCGHGAGVCA